MKRRLNVVGRGMSRMSALRFSLGFEALERRAMLAAVLNFGLFDDTGYVATDGVTSNPSVEGEVDWSGSTQNVRVEFDHDGDGLKEGSVLAANSGDQFIYDALAADPSLNAHQGAFTLYYRTVEIEGGEETEGSWQSFSFTLDRVAPSVLTFAPSNSSVVNGSPSAVMITFNEMVSTLPSGGSHVEVQSTSQQPSQTVQQVAPDKVRITFPSALAADTYLTKVENYQDVAGNTLISAEAWWRVNEAPTTTGLPDVNVEEDAADTVLALYDYFTDSYDPASSLDFSIVDNTNPDLFSATTIDPNTGELTIDYAPNAFGESTVTVRAVDTSGMWIDTVFDIVTNTLDDPPEIVGFGGAQQGLTWTFTGTVTDPDDDVSLMVITFGGLLEGDSTEVLPDGSFTHVKSLFSNGEVTAQTFDTQSNPSNVAEYYVDFN